MNLADAIERLKGVVAFAFGFAIVLEKCLMGQEGIDVFEGRVGVLLEVLVFCSIESTLVSLCECYD